MRHWRAFLQLVLLASGVTLTVANSMAPPVRHLAKVEATTGRLEVKLDQRVYRDKAFGATLPAGRYDLVLLERLVATHGSMPGKPVPGQGESKPEVLLRIEKGDPRLGGDPVRIELLRPQAIDSGGARHGVYMEGGEYVLTVRGEHGEERVTFSIETTRR